MAVRFDECMARAAANLSDDQLLWELRCAERCALLAMRSSREMARWRIMVLRREVDRRRRANLAVVSDS